MLSNDELAALCLRLGLSEQAKAVVASVRSAPPSRRVRGAAGNVTVRYPSRKMGVTIQAESHRNELAGIYEKEHDPGTLEFYDQPPPIKLRYQASNGRAVGVLHTPDYFVIHTDAVGWEEWKTEAELLKLSEKMPNRYRRDEEGRWRCPPGERYAEQFAFVYRVRSSAEIDWVFQRNLLFLEDFLRGDCPPVGEHAAVALIALVTKRPGIRLDELLGQVEGASSDDIYTLIATDRLHVDLRAAALAEPERVLVFRDAETARSHAVIAPAASLPPGGSGGSLTLAPGAPVLWDGQRWTVINLGRNLTALLAEDATLVELPNATLATLVGQGKLVGVAGPTPASISAAARERLAQAGPDDLREANRRHALIASMLSGDAAAAAATPARTLRRWLGRWRQAERTHNCGYVGLLPQQRRRGNRTRKLPEATLRLLDEFIAKDYETLKQKGKFAVYAALMRTCEEQGSTVPSYKTFIRAVNRRPRQEQMEQRQGKRAAYQAAAFFWELALTTPRHGDRPFEIGHIDHTQLDIELVCSRTGRPLGRPWATFLTDASSRRLLAVSLTFDPPSYRSCMMILRECVRRHQRLPQTAVVDGGAEFESVYFETLLARYECTKKTRPSAQPRFGSVCERLFGTTNTRFIHNLVGNTQIRQKARQVTKSVDPKQHACWTLGRLSTRLCEWAYEVYDTIEHPALGTTPREACAAGLAQSGWRPQRRIPYDEDFRMLTLPTTQRGTARLHPRLGVKVNYLYYWSEAFLDPEVHGARVPVRFDPLDAGQAYIFVKGRWVRGISEHRACFAGRSEREIQLATAELRRRHQRHGQQFTVTARKLADFLASLEAEEALLEQRLRDAEAKEVIRNVADDQPSPPTAPERASAAGAAARQPAETSGRNGVALVIYEDY
ncbi:MAG: DDE-type integrase/transposase/recombinase [Chloroflexi bacterium]|nr:DDE-type integrase/transposase/recombinase [Chloroflexota bacterium]